MHHDTQWLFHQKYNCRACTNHALPSSMVAYKEMDCPTAILVILAGAQIISAQGAAKCKLPLDEGRCDEKLQRLFFNATSGFCELFTYNGCGGNENNFVTYQECIDECQNPCRDPLGPVRCKEGVENRYYYDVDAGHCKETGFGFCSGHWDSFIGLEECKTHCEDVCTRPMDPGVCHSKQRRFYYNREENRCLPFIYTGCRGNGNRFHTQAMCHKMCRLQCGVRIGDDCPEINPR